MDDGHGRILPRSLFGALTAFALISFNTAAFANGTKYFINSQPDSSCSDSGPHTEAQPWCSFGPINRIQVMSPGDEVLLARGATWDQQLTLTGSGTPTLPITLSAYGKGANPRILRDQATDDICILLNDPGSWNIEHLEVGNASVGILLHFNQLSHQNIAINDVFAHDNKGIWSKFSREYPVSAGIPDPFAAALNINLSAGILFNIAPNLSFDSSQYVLKGISLTNIRGAHNLDSVSFDAETTTTDGNDGHNTFQDVVLNGLLLTDDDGHADSAYQAAGLGCSDSLRLVGMTNVTLIDSVLYDEAACHTASGTAAVIIARVQNVNLTNNIFFGVPTTESPDETAVDLEFSESQVNFLGNLFAANAGPGVEILNIHPYDHTTGVDLADNTFLNNAFSLSSGGVSIWENSAGSGFATPFGSVRNSVYTQASGAFFEGNDTGSITQLNNISATSFPNYAAEQFSPIQGLHQWRYMYEVSPAHWTDIQGYSPSDYNGAWEVSPEQYVSAFALVPASCDAPCNTGGVARVWVAPYSGTVDIRGRVLKSDAQGGTGVFAQINLVSGRNVSHLWPSTLGRRQSIAGTDQVGYPANVNNIEVRAGDMIRFEVNANGQNFYDTVSWTPSVAYISTLRPGIRLPPRPVRVAQQGHTPTSIEKPGR
ncbi:MAG TPA: hypothetical protein VGI45_04565 [Terracidiphilus sp.]|jgi:hypothetical protein